MRKTILPVLVGLSLFTMLAASSAGQGQKARPPVITPAGGRFGLNEPVRVSIRAEAECRIVYTLDGSFPSEGKGTRTESNLVFFDLPPGDVTVMATAERRGFSPSSTAKAVFTRSGAR